MDFKFISWIVGVTAVNCMKQILTIQKLYLGPWEICAPVIRGLIFQVFVMGGVASARTLA